MKLVYLHETKLREEDPDPNPFGEWLKQMVRRKVLSGGSKLKSLLAGSGFTLEHVRYAIIHGECLRNPDPSAKALGPTYLEQTISNVLRDLAQARQIPIGKFNDARMYFGLERLDMKQLKHARKS